MTNWTEINISIEQADLDRVSAIAMMSVPYGIYIEDYSDLETEAPKIANVDLIDESLLLRVNENAIVHIYISPDENPNEALSFLKDRLDAEEITYSVDTKNVNEEDWATAWKKYYHPVRISENVVVCPSWEEYEKERESDKIITLDPGMAFGTGTHHTTKLCVMLLDKYVKSGDAMLDVGTGSGILAIAATLLGCGNAIGVDIDETAVRVAKENATLNELDINFVSGDLVASVSGEFDIICANIVADVIIRLADSILPYLKEQGKFMVSGIIEEREDDVHMALTAKGLVRKDRLAEGGWVALMYMREE